MMSPHLKREWEWVCDLCLGGVLQGVLGQADDNNQRKKRYKMSSEEGGGGGAERRCCFEGEGDGERELVTCKDGSADTCTDMGGDAGLDWRGEGGREEGQKGLFLPIPPPAPPP